jgi:hypothetical protein
MQAGDVDAAGTRIAVRRWGDPGAPRRIVLDWLARLD